MAQLWKRRAQAVVEATAADSQELVLAVVSRPPNLFLAVGSRCLIFFSYAAMTLLRPLLLAASAVQLVSAQTASAVKRTSE